MEKSFNKGLIYTLLSFSLLAVSGIVMNTIIATLYSTAVLGLFNLCYAIFIVFSQFSILGLQYSSLRSCAVIKDKQELYENLGSVLLGAFIIAIIACIVLVILSPFFADIYGSPNIRLMIYYLTPGLFLFSINKVIMFSLNGLRMMGVYAIAQSIRYFLLMLVVLIVALDHFSYVYLTYCFTVSEALLLIFLLLRFFKQLPLLKISASILKQHYIYGLKASLVGILIELNSRIDVLLLGLFVNHAMVGVYSFAAMIYEGFQQLVVVLKNNINPILGRDIHENNMEKFFLFLKKIRKFCYGVGLVFLVLLFVAYEVYISILHLNAELKGGFAVLAILSVACYLASGIICLDNVFVLSNKPFYQSCYVLTVVIFNVVLNLLLIPMFGIIGAAMAAALAAYIVGPVYVYLLSLRVLKLDFIKLKYTG